MDGPEIVERYSDLRSERAKYEGMWQEIAEYICPNGGNFASEGKGDEGQKLNKKILDSTGVWAAETLSAAMFGYTTNPASPWASLAPLDPSVSVNDFEARSWLQHTQGYMQSLFASPSRRFYDQVHEMHLDLVPFGNGFLQWEERPGIGLTFRARSLKESYIDENSEGIIDTYCRKFQWTTRQLYQEFGDLPIDNWDKIKEKEPRRKWDIIHYIAPRLERDYKRLDAKNMPWCSYHILVEKKLVLRESGYRLFPILSPRWSKRAGELFGRGCGHMAVANIRMLQAMKSTTLIAGQLTAQPPLQGPSDSFLAPINFTPGAINWKASGYGNNDELKPIVTGCSPEFGRELMNDEKEAILRSFYVDKLQDGKAPTAEQTRAEYSGNQTERMLQLSPQLGRFNSEFTGPLYAGVLQHEIYMGRIPAPPQSLSGKPFMINYVSPLAKAQKLSQVDSINQAMQTLIPFMQQKPEIADTINEQGLANYVFNLYDTPVEVLNSPQQIQQIQQQRQQANDQANQANTIQSLGGASGAASLLTALGKQ